MPRGLVRLLACGAAAFAIGAIPAAASAASGSAQSSTTPTTTATSSTKPGKPGKPATKPSTPAPPASSAAKGSMRLYLFDAFFVSHEPVTVPGRVIHVTGIVRPYVPGQWVSVRVFLGHKLFKRDRLRVKPSKKRAYGAFAEKLQAHRRRRGPSRDRPP